MIQNDLPFSSQYFYRPQYGLRLCLCDFLLARQLYFAAMILILGAIFDMVDGRVARMTGTQSPFGEQFDSLSDVVLALLQLF